MDLSGNNKNKITGKKYQPVMSVTGLNDQGLSYVFSLECFNNRQLYTFNFNFFSLSITKTSFAFVFT